jgi:tetratricopeptide repeat protein 8
MIAQRDGPFLNLARLNVDKYARDKTVNRHLFDYVFMHESDMKTAQQVGAN